MDCQKQLLCHLDQMENSDEDLVEKFKYVNAIYAYVKFNFHVKFLSYPYLASFIKCSL